MDMARTVPVEIRQSEPEALGPNVTVENAGANTQTHA